ncbi:MAG: hypothetical protein MSA82_02280 [Oscillospiraceae bacterium]|nr:hypothetical protein [Oscillospiraceae bacterium]
MAYREKELTGQISAVSMSAALSASAEMSGTLKQADRVVEKDYEKLINRPSINGVELIKDKSLEDIGCIPMKNSEILSLIKIAKGGI